MSQRNHNIAALTGFFLLVLASTNGQSPSLDWARTFANVAAANIIEPTAVTTDVSGNVYTTGFFRGSRDFDPGPGSFNLSSAGGSDIFVSKLNATGGFAWAVRIGGTNSDVGNSIALDASGNVYVTGSYFGTVDFDPGPVIANLTGGGSFVLKLNSSGAFVWAKRIGSGIGSGITVDAFGDVITVGSFTGSDDFDPGTPVLTLTSFGSNDVFVSKLSPALGDLIWVKQMGGTLNDQGSSIDTDASGNVYTTGSFTGTADFDPGAGSQTLTSAGITDIFISKLSSTGNFVWAKRMGGTANEQGLSIAIDLTGNVLTTGSYSGTANFDPGESDLTLTSVGASDAFVSKLDASGLFVWAKSIGATGIDRGNGITTDGSGNVYYTGEFSGVADFDPGVGIFNLTPTMDPAAFISKLDAGGNFMWVESPRGPGVGWEAVGIAVAIDPFGKVIDTGWFNNTVDFEPGICDEFLTASSDDIYIWKLDPSTPPPTICIPRITNFSPASGAVGTSVTISGNRFSATPANNVVYFGATRANVTAATTTSLTVNVPVGATYAPITVNVTGAIAYSQRPFVVTFADGGVINSCSFSASTNYSSGNFGYGLATGDLDLDGKVDIVISNLTAGIFEIFRNTSTTGSIDATSFAASVSLPAGANVRRIDISDIDGDGKLDLIAAGFDSNIISIYRNIATPGTLNAASFEARVDLTTGARPFDVKAADLDGDGKTDIVTSTEGRLSFWRNIGTSGSITAGSFGARQDILINSISVAISDLDVDGKPDLIIAPALGTVARVYRNISTQGSLVPASFAAGVNFTVASGPDYIVIGDLDNDQRPEILISSWSGGAISILKNTSSPGTIDASSFAPKVDITGLSEPRGLSITDYDGDSKPDIALAMQFGSRIKLYKNVSTTGTITAGSFAPAVDFLSGGNLRAITGADFDGDGRPDLATTNYTGPPLSVLRNQIDPPTITDVTPLSEIMGAQVTITGVNFSPTPSANTVLFNGLPATVLTSTPTSITAIVPTNATTGPITVTKSCNVSNSVNFTVLPYTPPCYNVLLNGATDKILFSDQPSLEPAAVTVEAWVKVNAFTSTKSGGNTSSQFILFKRNQLITFSEGYDFVLNETTKTFQAVVSSGAGGAASQRILSTSANFVNLNQWYHLSLTADNVNVKFYINGQLIGTLSTGFALNYGPEGLCIGNASPLNTWQGAFNGNVDEVRIWNFVRSQSQLQSTMTGTLTGNEPGLVAYYNLDETGQGAGITVANRATGTGAINDGITVGSATTPIFTGSCSCQIQRDALIALYNATDGPNWNDNSGWLSPDVSTWYGVTVSGCNIIDVSLPGNNLIGNLPPEIGNLTFLEGLDLGANQLNGWIPPEIGSLTSLTALNLSLNQMDGPIPVEIGNLTNLQALGLAFNFFHGNLPLEMENLSSLTDAFLNNNQFSGDAPLIGGSSPGMSILNLQFNSLTNIPNFNSYSSISLINVASNRLTFDDLEPYIGLSNFFYDPQAQVPPGGIISFIPGGTLNIPFSTGGSANSYQWYKDNVMIPGATSASLSIPGVTAADVGFYHVKITSSIVPVLILESQIYTVITDPCASVTPTSGNLDTGFAPSIDTPSTFERIGLQSSGKIIASTSATVINSVAYSGLLRFHSDGTLDNTFAPNAYGKTFLILPDDRILATIAGNIERLDADGNTDPSFNNPSYYNGSILALARQSDAKIIVAVNTDGSLQVDRLNEDGTLDTPLIDGYGIDVTTIEIQSDGFILLGGEFTGGIIRLDPTGALDPGFAAVASDFVHDIAIQTDGKILVGGAFKYFNDIPKGNFVRLDTDGNLDPTFPALGITDLPEAGSYVERILIQTDGKIVLAGAFDTVNGADRRNLVRLSTDGTVDCFFDPAGSTDAPITGLAIQADGKLLISGGFSEYDATPRFGLARVNADGGGPPVITSFSPALGAVGQPITVTGTNFSPVPSENIVYFGATRTSVTSATTTQLVVPVPAGATFEPITATVGNLTAYAPSPFIPTFAGGGTIVPASFAAHVDFVNPAPTGSINIGDLDGDGRADMVVSSQSGTTGILSIYRNTSAPGAITSGSFATPVNLIKLNSQREGMSLADIDGDGMPEILAVDVINNRLSVFLNRSTPEPSTLTLHRSSMLASLIPH